MASVQNSYLLRPVGTIRQPYAQGIDVVVRGRL
jgi:hypothetical protein